MCRDCGVRLLAARECGFANAWKSQDPQEEFLKTVPQITQHKNLNGLGFRGLVLQCRFSARDTGVPWV